MLDCLIDGMNADIAKRQQKLKRTQEAQERVSEKVEDLKSQGSTVSPQES